MKLYQTDKVSIIILSRGCGMALINTLDSIFTQTYKNIEVFLIIDEVRDDFKIKISAYRDKIRYVIKQKGYAKARILNNTLKLINGRFFAILAAGDVWQPGSLGQKVNFLEKNKLAFAVCCDFDIFDKKGVLQDSFFEMKNLFKDIDNGHSFVIEESRRYLIKSSFRMFSTSLVRNESYLIFGPFDETSYDCADFDLFFKMAKKSKLGCINKVLAGKFFDIYKTSYYVNENIENRILYLEDLLASLYKVDRRHEQDIRLQIKRNYFSWATYLIKSKEKHEARKVATKYLVKHSIISGLLLLFFKTLLPGGTDLMRGKYDYFRTERLQNELLKLHF